MPYIAGTGEDAKCVYKKTKEGKRGAKVGCTKGDVKQYLRALYSADKKSAKDELAEIIEAFEVGKKMNELTTQLEEMKTKTQEMYAHITSDVYEESLEEIEKMHTEMKQLYNEIDKLGCYGCNR